MKTAGKISIAILILISLLSLFAPFISWYNPDKIDLDSLKEPPSFKHLFGTDNKGRDVFSRVLLGVSIIFPPGIYTVMIAIAAVGWASFARLIRGYILTLREAPFVEAARALGCSDMRMWMVLFPGLMIAVTALCFNTMGDTLRDRYGLKIKG